MYNASGEEKKEKSQVTFFEGAKSHGATQMHIFGKTMIKFETCVKPQQTFSHLSYIFLGDVVIIVLFF